MKIECYFERRMKMKIGILLLFISIGLTSCAGNQEINNKEVENPKVKNEVENPKVKNEIENSKNNRSWEEIFESNNEASYDYWSNVLENKNEKNELDYIIDWLKNKEYFTGLSIDYSGIKTLPDNKKTKKRIRSEEGFDRVKEYLLKTKYDIINNWSSQNRISFLHRFDMEVEDIHGNYCLEYGKVSEDRNYSKLCKNYYSYVIYYR